MSKLDSDAPHARKRAKRPTGSKKGKILAKKQVKTPLGALTELPLELVIKILGSLEHRDLYHLSLTSRALRAFVLSPAVEDFWVDGEEELELPFSELRLPMTRFQMAHLIYSNECYYCKRTNVDTTRYWHLKRIICDKCVKTHTTHWMHMSRRVKPIHPIAQKLIAHDGWGMRMYGQQPHFDVVSIDVTHPSDAFSRIPSRHGRAQPRSVLANFSTVFLAQAQRLSGTVRNAVPLERVRNLNDELWSDFPIPSKAQKSRLGGRFSLKNRNWIYLPGHRKPAPDDLVDLIEWELEMKEARISDGAVLTEWAYDVHDWKYEDRKQKTAGLKRRLRLEGWTEAE